LDKPIVTIARGKDRIATLRGSVGHQLEQVIPRGAEVLIKPNLVGGLPPDPGSSVYPETIAAVVALAKEAGAGKVIVAEDSGSHQDTADDYLRMGIVDALADTGAQLLDVSRAPHVKVPVENGLEVDWLLYAQPYLDAEVLINLTKLKTHHQAAVSGSFKNMYTAVPEMYKLMFHRRDLEKLLVDINSVRQADFVIIDGFPAMEGLGPANGRPVPMNVVISGQNMVATDAVAASVMGLDPSCVRHLALADRYGLGPSDLNQIEVRGTPIADVTRPFKTGLDQAKEEFGEYVEVVDRTRCSGCTSVAATVLMLLTRRPEALEEIKGTRIYVGPITPGEINWEGRVVLLGECIKGLEDYPGFVPGCPPSICEAMARVSIRDLRLTYFEREVELQERLCSYVCR
jgi:uncharacterized protein (DUF362 family)